MKGLIMGRMMVAFTLTALVSCASPEPAGPPGTLDTTLSGTGMIIFDHPARMNSGELAYKVAIQSDGKIVVAGAQGADTNVDLMVWRYNTDGTLDTSFGDDDPLSADPAVRLGYAGHGNAAGGDGNDYPLDVVLDDSGNILLSGISYNGAISGTPLEFSMALWRYTPDGVLDTSFGDDDPLSADPAVRLGYVTNKSPAGGPGYFEIGSSLALDGGSNIYVFGNSMDLGSGLNQLVIWKFTPSGDLDTAFNGSGILAYNNSDHNHATKGMFDANGKLVVAGYNMVGGFQRASVFRFHADGTLDTTFGDDDPADPNPAIHLGYAVWQLAGTSLPEDLDIDSLGRIVVTGARLNAAPDYDAFVWRLTPQGQTDTTFGDDDPFDADPAVRLGYVLQNFGADDWGFRIAVDSSDRVLVSGWSNNGTDMDMMLLRYLTDGTLDSGFNGTGIVMRHGDAGGDADDYGAGITFDNRGRIHVAGGSFNADGNSDMVVWRFWP